MIIIIINKEREYTMGEELGESNGRGIISNYIIIGKWWIGNKYYHFIGEVREKLSTKLEFNILRRLKKFVLCV